MIIPWVLSLTRYGWRFGVAAEQLIHDSTPTLAEGL
jgi:hypothetical protein